MNLSDQSVVIVGNGASLLREELGECIDAHDVVVRFNLFKIGGYARHVGTKTTHWFNNRDACSTQVRQTLKENAFTSIYVHTWFNTSDAVESFRQALNEFGRSTPVFEVEKSMLRDMSSFLGSGYSGFSTGAIGTWTMLKQFQRATLVGFDWWDNPEKFHYGDNLTFQYLPDRGHQPHLEKMMFEKIGRERLSIGFAGRRCESVD